MTPTVAPKQTVRARDYAGFVAWSGGGGFMAAPSLLDGDLCISPSGPFADPYEALAATAHRVCRRCYVRLREPTERFCGLCRKAFLGGIGEHLQPTWFCQHTVDPERCGLWQDSNGLSFDDVEGMYEEERGWEVAQ